MRPASVYLGGGVVVFSVESMDCNTNLSPFSHLGSLVSSPVDSGSAFSHPSNMTFDPVASKSGTEFSSVLAMILVLAIRASDICELIVLCHMSLYRRFCSSFAPADSLLELVGLMASCAS